MTPGSSLNEIKWHFLSALIFLKWKNNEVDGGRKNLGEIFEGAREDSGRNKTSSCCGLLVFSPRLVTGARELPAGISSLVAGESTTLTTELELSH